nr:helix-turn-helix domain-containing protein [uncultured Clostridium sp.]
MLTRSLQALEQHGLISRKELCQIPPHVEYTITERCKSLLPALEIINEWGKSKDTCLFLCVDAFHVMRGICEKQSAIF